MKFGIYDEAKKKVFYFFGLRLLALVSSTNVLKVHLKEVKQTLDNINRASLNYARATEYWFTKGWDEKVALPEQKSDEEALLAGLSPEALKHCKNFIDKRKMVYDNWMVPLTQFYTSEEYLSWKHYKQTMLSDNLVKHKGFYSWQEFKLPIPSLDGSVFYSHHGVDTLKHKDRINGKTILDVGCFIADSALMFRKLFPSSNIISFEPSASNFALAKKTLALNNLQDVKIEHCGLGDCNGMLCVEGSGAGTVVKKVRAKKSDERVQIRTLDDYVKEHNITDIGLIKVDIEGAEQSFLRGAKETICTQKPTMLISIYHQYEDFYKIKPMIDSWNVGYHFDFFQDPYMHNYADIMLICEVD